jgi:hypothetical protein
LVPREACCGGVRVGAGLLCGVGDGLEADSVAEGFELADRACLGLGGDTPGEVDPGGGHAVENAPGMRKYRVAYETEPRD